LKGEVCPSREVAKNRIAAASGIKDFIELILPPLMLMPSGVQT